MELRSLGPTAAETVARRLVATGELLDVDPAAALAHAVAARKMAPRIAAVREAVGLAAYHAGDWQQAIAELRAYHRMAGRQTHIAVVADCERALGKPERAIDTFRRTGRAEVGTAAWIELLIVASGARRDMGQAEASAAMLQIPELDGTGTEPWRVRLSYAYADALAGADRVDEARVWFDRTVTLDPSGETDAADRLLELDGILLEGDEEFEESPDESDGPENGPNGNRG